MCQGKRQALVLSPQVVDHRRPQVLAIKFYVVEIGAHFALHVTAKGRARALVATYVCVSVRVCVKAGGGLPEYTYLMEKVNEGKYLPMFSCVCGF